MNVILGVLLVLTAGALCTTAVVLLRVVRSDRRPVGPTNTAGSTSVAEPAAPPIAAPVSGASAGPGRPAPTASATAPPAPVAARSEKGSRPAVVSTLEATPPDQLERFSDVGGLDAIKQELRDVITLLVDPQEFAAQYRIGWNGVLLHGAPGVGKTLLARVRGRARPGVRVCEHRRRRVEMDR